MAKGFAKVTRCIGFSYSDVEPMSKEPAGNTTSSGQSVQSRNVSPGLKLVRPGSMAGAVVAGAVAGGCGGGGGRGGGAGGGRGGGGGGGGCRGGGGGGVGQAAAGGVAGNKTGRSGLKPPTEPARCWSRGTRRCAPG